MTDNRPTPFTPLPPEDAIHAEVIVGSGLQEHALVSAASADAGDRLSENEVLEHVVLGQLESTGTKGQDRLPYMYWKRTGP